MRTRFLEALHALGVCGALALSACAAKDDADDTTDDPDSGAASSEKYDVPHIDAGPVPEPFSFTSVEDPWPENTVAACKAFTSPEDAESPQTAVRECACDNCLDIVHQCDALQGCREIRACGLRVGCTTPYDCYLLPAVTPRDPTGEACVAVIDKWGNIGLSTYLSRKLQECTQAVPCPAPL